MKTFLTAAALSCFGYSVSAQVTFVFDDGSSTGAAGLALEGESNTTYTQGGIELSASTEFGIFNLTGSGFGPNDVGSLDDTDRFDGIESMVFSFNTAGTFQSIDLAALVGATETATLSFAGIGGGSTIFHLRDDVSSSIVSSGDDFFEGIDYDFAPGESITLSITVGNGWTLENFTVTAVPEPATYALIAGMLALASVVVRRRR